MTFPDELRSTNVDVVIVAAFIASLNVARTVVLRDTSVAPDTGATLVTIGGVVSSAGGGGGGAAVTVTVVCAAVDPALFIAVSV
jgi:hypothetical protein